MSPSIRRRFLALSSAHKIHSPSVCLLPPGDASVDCLVRAALRKLGKRLDFRVTQNVPVDLDGDGKTDRLVVIEFRAELDPEAESLALDLDGDGKTDQLVPIRPIPEPNPGAMILAMFERSHGDAQTKVVMDAADDVGGQIAQASILAVIDITDGGLCEVAIEVHAQDYSAYEVYDYGGKRFKRVLVWLVSE